MNSPTVLYFAYGSNMLERRLKDPKRVPSAKHEAVGYIEGHRLTFDKVSKDGSGKCDAQQTGMIGGSGLRGFVYHSREREGFSG